jgi:hypothetical protein
MSFPSLAARLVAMGSDHRVCVLPRAAVAHDLKCTIPQVARLAFVLMDSWAQSKAQALEAWSKEYLARKVRIICVVFVRNAS